MFTGAGFVASLARRREGHWYWVDDGEIGTYGKTPECTVGHRSLGGNEVFLPYPTPPESTTGGVDTDGFRQYPNKNLYPSFINNKDPTSLDPPHTLRRALRHDPGKVVPLMFPRSSTTTAHPLLSFGDVRSLVPPPPPSAGSFGGRGTPFSG